MYFVKMIASGRVRKRDVKNTEPPTITAARSGFSIIDPSPFTADINKKNMSPNIAAVSNMFTPLAGKNVDPRMSLCPRNEGPNSKPAWQELYMYIYKLLDSQ